MDLDDFQEPEEPSMALFRAVNVALSTLNYPKAIENGVGPKAIGLTLANLDENGWMLVRKADAPR